MKITKKHLLSALILSFFFFLSAGVGLAQEASPNSSTWDSQIGMTEVGSQYGENSGQPTNIKVIIARLINYSIQLLGVIFLVLFIVSGFQWMTAGGNEDEVSKAQSRIKTAIIGLVITLSAYAVWAFVAERLLY